MGQLILLAIIIACIIFRIPKKLVNFCILTPQFIYWKIKDIQQARGAKRSFSYFGTSLLCGRQGSGKTIGLVYMINKIKREFPKAKVYTNFGYKKEDGVFYDWKQLINGDLLNGEDGVIIGWDELQNDFSSTQFKDFPESLLSEVTQQRKQKMCILATSQVYKRVVKSLREQTYHVIECRTYFKRLTRLRCYDADDYNEFIDNPNPKGKFKMHKEWQYIFVQNDVIRNMYDTYKKIQRMSKQTFIPRNERVS